MYECMHIYIYIYIYICMYMYVCMYVCIYVCICCICMYMYISCAGGRQLADGASELPVFHLEVARLPD
jgi:hypothetical protein